MFKSDDFRIDFLLRRGHFVRQVLSEMRILIHKEHGAIEWRRVAFAYAPRAKKYGGINLVLDELETEGSIHVDIVPTRHGMMKTINVPELVKKDQK